jgi:hypothetical protein
VLVAGTLYLLQGLDLWRAHTESSSASEPRTLPVSVIAHTLRLFRFALPHNDTSALIAYPVCYACRFDAVLGDMHCGPVLVCDHAYVLM